MPRTDPRLAGEFLSARDPYLASVIRRVGVRSPPRRPGGFRALARSIIYQQISGSAGAAIVRRLERASGTQEFPEPGWFRSSSTERLRAAGLSPQKIGYLRDLARRVEGGELDLPSLARLPDEAVVEKLTEVHGIGRWTAQMYLLFYLGRPDVWPVGDLGIRKAVQRMRGMQALPSDRTMERVGRPWSPYRSHAAYYLWRSLEHSPEQFIVPAGLPAARPLTAASRRNATRPTPRRR
jgi:DNA-3-methyladenine glycosylase II